MDKPPVSHSRYGLAGKARILLVDDEPANLLDLESILRELGEILVRARSRDEALAALQKEEFALAILKSRMPGMEGVAAARLIREEAGRENLPLIFIAPNPCEARDLEGAYDLGAMDVLVHPVSPSALRAKTRVLLELYRSRAFLSQRVAERTAELQKEVVERQRTEARITDELRALLRLKEIGEICSRPGIDSQRCLEDSLRAAIELSGAQKGNIQLVDPASDRLRIVAQQGFDETFLRYFETVDDHHRTPCDGALRSGRRIVVENVQESPLFLGQEELKVLLRAAVRAVQSTPLLNSAGKILGIMSTHFRRPHHFDERELGWLDLLARQTANYIERKRAEEGLQASEQRERARAAELQAVMESVPAAIWIARDGQGKVITGNTQSYEYLGVTPGENVSKTAPEGESSTPFEIYIDGKRALPEELPIQRVAATGIPIFSHELEIRLPDGRSRWIYGNTVPLMDEEGKVKQVVEAAVDVTERRQVQEALQESRERHRFLADAGSVMTSTLDFEGQLETLAGLAVSRIADACVIYLLGDQGKLRRAALAHSAPWRAAELLRMEEERSRTLEGPFAHPLVLRTAEPQLLSEITDEGLQSAPDSPEALALLRDVGFRSYLCLPLRAREKLLGVLILATDVSGRRFGSDDLAFGQELANRMAIAIDNARLYKSVVEFNKVLEQRVEERTAELRDAVTELEGFSYTVAHDLRAPLRAVASFGEVLKDDYGEKLDEGGRLYLDRIIGAAHRMDSLVQDLLSYSRLGRGDVALEAVDVEALVSEVLAAMDDECRERHARVRIVGSIPPVIAHRVMLSQTLSNLIGNAIKFVEPGVQPEVRLEGESRDGKVRIWIIDNGIGIEEDYHLSIFDIFHRLHPDRFPGTGVGLAIVKKALDRMGGDSGVESSAGKGSRFWVELQRAQVPEGPTSERARAEGPLSKWGNGGRARTKGSQS